MQSQTNAETNIIKERVEFLCDKSLFKGKVYRPLNLDDCKGIVIFTHGLGYCDRQYEIHGEDFAKQKYLMLTYNLRGHAGTPGKWTLQNSVEDLIEGINFLTRRYDFPNKERICVIGHSTGALITLLASLKDKRIKFGSVVTTVTSLKESYLHWFKSGFNKEVKEFFKTKGVIPPLIEKFMDDRKMIDRFMANEIPETDLHIPHRYGLLRSDDWGEFFHEIAYSVNILDLAEQISIPLLLFRGEYDEVMDVNKTNELYEKLNKKISSKLYITDSKNHFHNDRWEMIQAETLKFFDMFCEIKKKGVALEHKNILIIDDEPLVTKSLQHLLKKSGLPNVTVAHSGEDALKVIRVLKEQKDQEFDLIIADIRMPGVDGIETVRRMKEIMANNHEKESPVIFITGYEGNRTQEEARALGYVDYFYKPLDVGIFLNAVKKHLHT